MKLALLAGGKATRLYPKTQTIAKSMVEVAGKPFIAHQLALLKGQGITDIVLCVGQFAGQIRDFVGDGAAFGVNVSYSVEPADRLLGTGGALKQALPLLGDAFWVMYGDSYLPVDFAPVEARFKQSGQPALMTVYRNQNRFDKSNVEFRDGRISRYDKAHPGPEMEHIDYGLGILTPAAFAGRPESAAFDLADVYKTLAEENRLAGYEVGERFYEIGSPDGLEETQAFLRG